LFLGVAGKDVLAKAKTGTGKTVAFLVFLDLHPD
jgi:superfamily II DNA/RNA helicase